MKTYEFDGADIHIGDIHVFPSGLIYFVDAYCPRFQSNSSFAHVLDDFGNLVKVPLDSAEQRAHFRAALH